jgi:hypothetical protein
MPRNYFKELKLYFKVLYSPPLEGVGGGQKIYNYEKNKNQIQLCRP